MSTTLNLFQIDRELEALEAELVDAGGVLDEDLEARYDALLDARDDKWEAYVAVIRRQEASAKAFDDELRRLKQLAQAHANTAKRMKERLHDSMLAAGLDTAETKLGKVRVQRASSRPVEVLVDVADLPERFVRRFDPQADLSAIKQALKDGDEEAARIAAMGEASTYVRIY